MNEIQFLMYDADKKVEVLVRDETIWATQKVLSKLFDADKSAQNKNQCLNISATSDGSYIRSEYPLYSDCDSL